MEDYVSKLIKEKKKEKEEVGLKPDHDRAYIDQTLSSMQESAKYWWDPNSLSNHGETSKWAMFSV